MRMKQLAVAIALIGAGAAINAQAEEKVNKVERVEVTGSSIKRIKKEGATPIETLNRKSIEKTGATTVQELVKSVASVDFNDYGEQASNSPTGSGGSSIKMRGLPESDVLVLLNGRRLPSNAFTDVQGNGSAVDINMIPLSAIERIEVLKDGGSAVYGADAVAGVVNFITKKNYQGGEVRTGLGQSSRGDGTEKSFGFSGGYGDYDEQGFNVFGSVDVLKRDPIYSKDRELTASADYSRFSDMGGYDARSNSSPYGNIRKDGKWTQVNNSCPSANVAADGRCKYDFYSDLLTSHNGADRINGVLFGNLKVSEDIRAYAQAVYSLNKDHFEAHPVPGVQMPVVGGWDIGANGKRKGPFYAGRFMQAGPRITDREASLWQLVLGMDGNFKGFDWSVAAGHGASKATNQDRNYIIQDKFFDYLNRGLIDGTSTKNDPARLAEISVNPYREATSESSFLEGKISGETGIQLPGGVLAFAVGVGITRESLTDTPDEWQRSGNVFGSIKQGDVDASRVGKAVFAELAIPVIKDLELQAALRYDSYDTASKMSPRFAARYQPIPELMLRSSYSKSFRMPTLKQLNGNPEEGAQKFVGEQCTFVNAPANDCPKDGYRRTAANKNLKPETGDSFNFGVVVDVGPFSGSLDWWKNNKSDVIVTPELNEVLRKGSIDFSDQSKGPIAVQKIENRSKLAIEGIDTDIKFRFPTDFATFTISNNNTYYLRNEQSNAEGVMWNYLEIYSSDTPNTKWRNIFRVDVEKAGWLFGAAARTTSGFMDTDASWDDADNFDPATRKVPSHTELDLVVSYSGFKNLKIDAGVKNTLDEMPPFSVIAVNNSRPGHAPIYSTRGRYFSLGAKYSF
jgi:iron complex outermembrane recepter protein